MIRTLPALALLIVMPHSAFSATLPSACMSTAPSVGRLDIRGGSVRLVRSEDTFDLRDAGELDLCARDKLILASGRATIIVGRVETHMTAGRLYTLAPYSEGLTFVRFIADLLKENWDWRSALAQSATSAGQGDDDAITFRVAGLDTQTAQVGAGDRSLQVTFTGPPRARATLLGPNGRTVPGQSVRTTRVQAPRVRFPKTSFTAGEQWTIRITVNGSTTSGSFRVTEGPLILPEITADPGGQDGRVLRSLALAGSDPERWSFEALQEVLEPGSALYIPDKAERMLAGWKVDASTRPGKEKP